MGKWNLETGDQKYSFGVIFIFIFGGLIIMSIFWAIYSEDRSNFIQRNLWDWIDLLLVPTLLILLIPGANWVVKKAQERQAQMKHEIALDDQRETALRSYMDLMTVLIIEKGLLSKEDQGKLRDLARVYTLDVLRCLDGVRKGRVVQFLFDAELIYSEDTIIELRGADLKGLRLEGANLRRISLSETILQDAYLDEVKLSGAKLMDVDLKGSHLQNAELIEADLSRGDMSGVDLRGTILTRANLHMAEMKGVDLRQAYLEGANLEAAKLVNADLSGAYLMDAILQNTCLRNANLKGAYLDSADLSACDLSGADLEDTVLSKAILVDAKITDHQLEMVKTLEKAIMS
jgi:uncharacterized protein YjbI with pentapeptide repeats